MTKATGQVELINRYGLHQRPAMKVIETATPFKSEIFLIREDMRCNAKSIIDIVMLAAEKGVVLTVEAEGEDAHDAVQAIQDLFQRKFDLDED